MRPGESPVRPLSDAGFDTDTEESSLSWGQVQHLLHAPLRHPLMVVLPWAGVLLLSAAALFILPKKIGPPRSS